MSVLGGFKWGCKLMINENSNALSVVTALIALYIAYEQWKTNRDKVKLELYDRRYKIYDETRRFISSAVRNGDLTNEDFSKFYEVLPETRFLFQDDVYSYMQELINKGANLHADSVIASGSSENPHYKNAVEKAGDIVNWYGKQYDKLHVIFKPYLSFEKLR